MAVLENLSVERAAASRGQGGTRLRVRFQVCLNARERRVPGLYFKEKVQLFAASPLGEERFLYELEPATFEARADGLVRRERLIAVPPDRDLDEGLGGDGRVTARVWITPRLPEPSSPEPGSPELGSPELGSKEQRLEYCF